MNDAITLTIKRTFDEILSSEDIMVCLRIIGPAGDSFHADGVVVRTGSAAREQVANVSPSPGVYTLRWTYNWPPDNKPLTCLTDLDLSEPFDVTATVHLRPRCIADVEQTAGWADTQGLPVSDSEVVDFVTGGHCNWGRAHFIAIGGYVQGAAYVNDVSGFFDNSRFLSSATRLRLELAEDFEYRGLELDATDYLTFDADAVLPRDAVTLWFTRGFRELFTNPADNGDCLYVVSDRGVERWPRIQPAPICS